VALDAGYSSFHLESPKLHLDGKAWHVVFLTLELESMATISFAAASWFREYGRRTVRTRGRIVCSLVLPPVRGRSLRLLLEALPEGAGTTLSISDPVFEVWSYPAGELAAAQGTTALPHWNFLQRALHGVCRRSRFWNMVVAAFEIHMGRDELLSLPQYMAFCPTGQCNASCGFCSVTINRTGIVKRQLPFDKLDRLIGPAEATSVLFGLEGNGEPTLYDDFDPLLLRLTRSGSKAYLITNAERISEQRMALLLACPVDSINVSLNAATAATHNKVMRLKSFEDVVCNIRRMIQWRKSPLKPRVSVSIVVTRDNAHEVQRFLYFAEWNLRVDRILVRPLSEIANESGSVEDHRNLVPYEEDINDMLDSVEDYLEAFPRRSEILIDPTSFRAFRHAPPGRMIHPPGLNGAFLAPRRRHWSVTDPTVKVGWSLGRLRIAAEGDSSPGVFMESAAVPVEPRKRLSLAICFELKEGWPLRLELLGGQDKLSDKCH